MFNRTTVLATVLLAFTVPALSNPVVAEPRPMIMLRDSDGIVISVLDWVDIYSTLGTTGGIMPGGVFYTFDGPVATLTGGGTTLPRDGSTLTGQPIFLGGPELLSAGAGGQVLDIGGVTYRVEADGAQVWLRDIATGTRHAAARHVAHVAPDAQGLAVNPTSFALD